jgi:hypothetical protein
MAPGRSPPHPTDPRPEILPGASRAGDVVPWSSPCHAGGSESTLRRREGEPGARRLFAEAGGEGYIPSGPIL